MSISSAVKIIFGNDDIHPKEKQINKDQKYFQNFPKKLVLQQNWETKTQR